MIQDRWVPIFAEGTLETGKQYFEDGKVSGLAKLKDGYSALVSGIKKQQVRFLTLGEKVASMECGCLYFKTHHACLHLAAALYALEDTYGPLQPQPYLHGEGVSQKAQKIIEGKKEPQERSNTEEAKETQSPGDQVQLSLTTSLSSDPPGQAPSPSESLPQGSPFAPMEEGQRQERQQDAEAKEEEPEAPPLPKGAPPISSLTSLNSMQNEQHRQREQRFKKTKEDEYRDLLLRYQSGHFPDSVFISPALKAQAEELLRQRRHNSIRVHIDKDPSYPLETSVCQASFDSIVPIEKNGWTTQVLFTPNRILKFTCTAKDHPVHDGTTPICAHEVAALSLSRNYIRIHSGSSCTDEVGERLLSLRGEIGLEPVQEEKKKKQKETPDAPSSPVEQKPRKRIVTRINIASHPSARPKSTIHSLSPILEVYEGGVLRAGIQLSCLPLILDPLTLMKNIKKGKPFNVGEVTFTVKRDNLTRESQNYLGYMEELYKKNMDLTLFEEDMDAFFNFGFGRQVLVRFHNHEPLREEHFTFWDGRLPKVSLRIDTESQPHVGSFSGLLIHGEVPHMVFGKSYSYYFQAQNFVRCKISSRALKEILSLAREGHFMAHIGSEHLGEFVYQTLPWMRTYVSIPSFNPTRIQAYLPQKAEIIVYFDYLDQTLLCKAETCYGKNAFPLGSLYMKKEGALRKEGSLRDQELEKQVVELICKYLPYYDEKKDVFYAPKSNALTDLIFTEAMEQFYRLCDVRATDRFRNLRKKRVTPFEMNVSLVDGNLHFSFASEYSEEELKDIMDAVVRKAKYVKLKSGELINVDKDEDMAALVQLMEQMHVPLEEFVKGKMSIPAYRALYLDQMLKKKRNIYIQRNEIFTQLISKVEDMGSAAFPMPKGFNGTLRSYQQVGYHWLRTLDQYGFGGILADEMGLGKTPQTISALLAIYEEEWSHNWSVTEKLEQHLPSLIVCPASLIYNWYAELKKFAPHLSVGLISGPPWMRMRVLRSCKGFDVVITSYDFVRRDIQDYKDINFRFLILDEAQYIKNRNTSTSMAVKLLNGRSKLALTGTPVENHLADLWSIFDFLMPGFLFSYWEFRSQLEQPIVMGKNQEKLDELKKMITPFILRRKKKDVLKDLPDKLEEICYTTMDEDQNRLYSAIKSAAKQRLAIQSKTGELTRFMILAALSQLRQVCCDPSLYDLAYTGSSAKREMCMELVRSLVEQGHKAAIFSQFTSMLSLLEEDLEEEGIDYYKITGSTEKQDRLRLVNEFNQNQVPIFLVSLKAGGTGLNLTGADVVIHYDPWWNQAAENQATDRAHRIGQTRVVTVYKLILKNTIEEQILTMQEKKAAMAEEILSGEGISDGTISKAELLSLFDL